MNDNEKNVLDKYPIKIERTTRCRGAICCESEQELFRLQEMNVYPPKMKQINDVLESLMSVGYDRVDLIINNSEEDIFTIGEEEKKYILKKWFKGMECDTKNTRDLMLAVRELAVLHKELGKINHTNMNYIPVNNFLNECEKRNSELKRVKNYIYKRKRKTEFELCFLRNYNYFMEQGLNSIEEIKKHDDEVKRGLCHGDFTHHNVIIDHETATITNYDKMCIDNQIMDLAGFLRKIMEKHNWDYKLGIMIIENYIKHRDISKAELISLHTRLSYPEKFWKISSQYYNSNKAWIPEKIIKKIRKTEEQEVRRSSFIKDLREWIEFCN